LFVLIPLLITACQPGNVPTTVPDLQPTVTIFSTLPVEGPTQPPPAETQPAEQTTSGIPLDLSGLAQGQTVEIVPAVSASGGGPNWEVGPEYRRITLEGYPVTSHLLKPQIFVYPVAGLVKSNEAAGQIAANLRAYLQNPQPIETMPFLPLFNAQQVLHAKTEALNFQNGSGVRFITQFDQAPLPINNNELFYTYQGLTGDGRYYITAVLPINHPDLPANAQVNDQQAQELRDFTAYLAKTVEWLEQQPGSSFTPDLANIDTLIQSIEISDK
jgi:hypothetical protein